MYKTAGRCITRCCTTYLTLALIHQRTHTLCDAALRFRDFHLQHYKCSLHFDQHSTLDRNICRCSFSSTDDHSDGTRHDERPSNGPSRSLPLHQPRRSNWLRTNGSKPRGHWFQTCFLSDHAGKPHDMLSPLITGALFDHLIDERDFTTRCHCLRSSSRLARCSIQRESFGDIKKWWVTHGEGELFGCNYI